MSKNRKITTEEFDYLAHMDRYIPEEGYKEMKYALLNTIEGVFGDKWFNLKESTRQAIDYICFLSLDRGFLYASPDHIAEKYSIARSTVYEALKVLREHDLLFKGNRSSKKQNGLGCAVHFFSIHPYFERITAFLNVEWKAQEKADRKAESVPNPCPARDSEPISTPTYSLPALDLSSKDIDLHINVEEQPSRKSIVKYVPKEINAVYAGIFDFRLRFIWQKVTQAWKTIKHHSLDRSFLIETGTKIVKRIYQLWKEKTRSGEEMTVDEMCAFAYKATRDSVYGTLAIEYLEDYDSEMMGLIGKAIRDIPKLEQIVRMNPDYSSYSDVRDQVMSCIEWDNRWLSPESLLSLMNGVLANYRKHSTLSPLGSL